MKRKNKKNGLKVVSLFCGCGGLDLGFIQAGFNVIWANDFDKDAVETYRLNIGDHVFLGDITKIKNDDIPDKFDCLLGGFPCQGFSVANSKRNMKEDRNFLYKEMLRIIKDKKPKFFLAENVKGILSLGKGRVIKMIIKDFEQLGYKVEYRILKSSDFGVPQNRERVFIMGNRLGLMNIFPEATHGVPNLFNPKIMPKVNTKDAISYLANIPTSIKPIRIGSKLIHNHIARTNVQDEFWARKNPPNQHEICDYLKAWRNKSGWTTKKIDDHFGYKHTAGHWFRKDNNSGSIPNPEDWWGLKKILGFDNKFDNAVTEMILKPITFEQSLRISNWDEPSDTITATGPEIHPNKKRRLSVREAAILQSFPDSFIFTGSIHSMYQQIGNSVSVKVAHQIAKCIKRNLLKKS